MPLNEVRNEVRNKVRKVSEYIDATKLKNQITDYKKAVHCRNSDYLNGYISALSAVEGMIAETPTADVAEVKHGKWIIEPKQSYIPVEYDATGELVLHDYTSYRCNLCDRVFTSKVPYCNCGAKME